VTFVTGDAEEGRSVEGAFVSGDAVVGCTVVGRSVEGVFVSGDAVVGCTVVGMFTFFVGSLVFSTSNPEVSSDTELNESSNILNSLSLSMVSPSCSLSWFCSSFTRFRVESMPS
jgi:hypothetical protein